MCDEKVCGSPCLLENEIKKLECENRHLTDKLQETQQWLDTKMKQQMVLYRQMVANYHKMMTKCNVNEDQMKKIGSQNDRFKVVAQCLVDKMEESDCCNMDKHSTKSDTDDLNNPIVLLEECVKSLLDEFSENKIQLKKVTSELSVVKCQLEKSKETGKVLRQSLANITELGDTDRERRDKDEATLRCDVKRLEAELEAELDSKQATDKNNISLVKSAINDLIAEVKELNVNSKMCMDELRAENATLLAELKSHRAKALAAKSMNFDDRRKFGATPSTYRDENYVHEYMSSSYSLQLERGDDDQKMICSTSTESTYNTTVTIMTADNDPTADCVNQMVPQRLSSVISVDRNRDVMQRSYSQNEECKDKYDLNVILNKYG